MTIWIFCKISVTALAAVKFKRSSWIVLYKQINIEGRLELNLGKIHRGVQIWLNFEFFKKRADLLQGPQNLNFEPNSSLWLYPGILFFFNVVETGEDV